VLRLRQGNIAYTLLVAVYYFILSFSSFIEKAGFFL
jgi:hypothetical protein